MSLLRSCPCGIPEGTDLPHLRTDCPHYGQMVTFPTALGHGGYFQGPLPESDDARKVGPRPRRPILKLRMGGK